MASEQKKPGIIGRTVGCIGYLVGGTLVAGTGFAAAGGLVAGAVIFGPDMFRKEDVPYERILNAKAKTNSHGWQYRAAGITQQYRIITRPLLKGGNVDQRRGQDLLFWGLLDQFQ